MTPQITFSYFSHEVQSFRRQLSKFEPILLFTLKVTDDRSEQVLIFFIKLEKSEFHALFKHLFLMRKNTVQRKQWPGRSEGQKTLLLQKLQKSMTSY